MAAAVGWVSFWPDLWPFFLDNRIAVERSLESAGGRELLAELWISKEAVKQATGWSERTIRWKRELSGSECPALVRHDPKQNRLFASLPEVSEVERVGFSPVQNAQAVKRLEVIAPLLEFAKRSKPSRPTFRTTRGTAVRSMNSLASYLAEQHQISTRTLSTWTADFWDG